MAQLVYREPDEVVTRLLCERISQGDSNEQACQLAGLDPHLIAEWLKRATKTKGVQYRDFRACYTKALAARKQQEQKLTPLIQGFDVARLCTPERLDQIFSYMEKGVFPSIAIEATGIPASVFYEILTDGQQNSTSPYRDLYIRFITMQAVARAGAEMRVYEDSPLAWLMNGPGRDRPSNPGWTRQSAVTGSDGGAIQVVTTHWGGATTTPTVQTPLRATIIEAEG